MAVALASTLRLDAVGSGWQVGTDRAVGILESMARSKSRMRVRRAEKVMIND